MSNDNKPLHLDYIDESISKVRIKLGGQRDRLEITEHWGMVLDTWVVMRYSNAILTLRLLYNVS